MELKENEEFAPVPVAAEEAADFARLGAMVGDEAGAAVAAPGLEPAPVVDAAESLAGFLSMAAQGGELFGFPQAAAVWQPETCQAVAEKTVPLLKKYPWGARFVAFFESGAGAEEAALVAVLLPVGFATAAAVRLDLAARRAAAEAEAAPVSAPRGPVMAEVHDADPDKRHGYAD